MDILIYWPHLLEQIYSLDTQFQFSRRTHAGKSEEKKKKKKRKKEEEKEEKEEKEEEERELPSPSIVDAYGCELPLIPRPNEDFQVSGEEEEEEGEEEEEEEEDKESQK